MASKDMSLHDIHLEESSLEDKPPPGGGACQGARLPCHVDLHWPHSFPDHSTDPWVAHLLCATIVCYHTRSTPAVCYHSVLPCTPLCYHTRSTPAVCYHSVLPCTPLCYDECYDTHLLVLRYELCSARPHGQPIKGRPSGQCNH